MKLSRRGFLSTIAAVSAASAIPASAFASVETPAVAASPIVNGEFIRQNIDQLASKWNAIPQNIQFWAPTREQIMAKQFHEIEIPSEIAEFHPEVEEFMRVMLENSGTLEETDEDFELVKQEVKSWYDGKKAGTVTAEQYDELSDHAKTLVAFRELLASKRIRITPFLLKSFEKFAMNYQSIILSA